MWIYKKIAFLSVISCFSLYGAQKDYVCKEEYNEDELLNELVTRHLKEDGIDANLCFCGDLDLTTAFVNQSDKGDYDSASTSLQGNVNLKYLEKMDGYGLGFEVGIKTRSGIIKQGSAIVDSSYVFVESDKIGILKFGYTNTAADSFSICGDKFLKGYQGPGSGNFGSFYNQSSGSVISTGCLYDDGKSAKIAWLSPILSGFSTGLSFTFDGRDSNLFRTKHHKLDNTHDQKEDFAHMSAVHSKNVITGGVAYECGAPDDFNAKLSIAGWFGRGKSGCCAKVRDVRAYNIGAIVGYKDFKMSFGYTDHGKSLLAVKYADQDMRGSYDPNIPYDISDHDIGLRAGADSGKLYSVGASYTFNKLTVSAGYFNSVVKFSENEKAKADIISLAAEYKFNKTLGLYVEYDNIITKTCDRARAYARACDSLSDTGNNRANIIMIGTKINF